MTRKNYLGLLVALYVMIMSLVYVGQGNVAVHGFVMLLLPWILLAGGLNGNSGALTAAVVASLSIAVASPLGMLHREAAVVDVISFFIVFGLAVLYNRERERRQRRYAEAVLPKQADLARVERKGQLIRNQIEEYESRLKALVKLYEATKKLSVELDLDALLDEARSVVARILTNHFLPQAESETRLAFYVPEEPSGIFVRKPSRGHEVSDEGFAERLEPPVLKRLLGEGLGVVRVKDLSSVQGRFDDLLGDGALRSLIAMPLVTHEIVIGLMFLASSQAGAFSSADYNKMNVLGKQIVLSLRKALLYRKVQTLSITDSQTGLYVHRHFQLRLREEIHRAERYRQFLSLIMLDLDHFKQINDQHGHQVGDAVLTDTAAKIREMAGSAAFIARYGGEEFAIILPNTPKSKAFQVAGLINQFIKAAPVEVAALRVPVTISAGVSTYPEDALERETLIATADAAMYEAKRQGRDRVMVFSEDQLKK